MPKALPIPRDDPTAADLREAATRGNDADGRMCVICVGWPQSSEPPGRRTRRVVLKTPGSRSSANV